MKRVWPDTTVEEGNLAFNISTLRKALRDDPQRHEFIVTIPGEGYQFVAGVRAGFDELEVRERIRVTIEEDEKPEAKLSAPHTSVRSIAVLPFKPLVAESRDEYLELGIADALITALSSTRQIIVRPTSAISKYAQTQQDPLTAGRELEVEAVLEGSLQRDGARIRVTARLLSVNDGSPLWAGKFDEKFTDIFTVQDAISERVTAALSLRLSGEERKRLTKRYTENSEAFQLYLMGRYHWSRFFTAESAGKGLEYFKKAIEKDPNYALPYVGLADAYILLGQSGTMPVNEAYHKAREMIMLALEKDDKLAEAHVSLASISRDYDWNWPEAETHFKRAIELNPNSPELVNSTGYF